jgi:ribokinase
MNLPSPRLVCLGNLTFDDVVLPDGTERLGCTGGDALYAVLAARLFEPSSEMVAPVGRDFPQSLRCRIADAGLSDSGMPARRGTTLHNRVAYDSEGGRTWTIYDSDDDFHEMSPTFDDIPPRFREAEAFLVLGMTLQAQIDLAEGIRASTGALLALDPQEDYIAGNEQALRDLIARTDIFMPSAIEVSRLLGHERWDDGARELAALGPRIVVVKLGAEGCLVFDRRADRMFRVAALPADVVDTTGAGDRFCGAFMGAFLSTGGDLEQAARAAILAASFSVEGYGVDPLWALDRDAIADRAQQLLT